MMMQVQLNDKHLDFLSLATRPTTRLLVAEGTVRSSKTVAALQAFYLAVKFSKDRVHCISAKDYDSIKDNLLECNGLGLLELFPEIKMVRFKIGAHYLLMKGADGQSKIILLAGYDTKRQWKKILGKTIGCFLVDEVNIADKTFIEESFARQVSSDSPLTIWTLNGDNPQHYIYQEYINYCKIIGKAPKSIHDDMDVVENKKGYYYMHWTMADNPVMTPEKIDAAKSIYPIGSYYYTIKILGERGIAEGLIYTIFATNAEAYILHKVPKLQNIVVGVDFGGNGSAHTFVATGIGPQMQYAVHLESKRVNATGITPDQLADEFEKFVVMIQKKYGFMAFECYCDSAEQTLINGLKNRVLHKKLGVIVKNAHKKPINDRIEFQLMLLSTKRLFFMFTATTCIEAYRTAVYNSQKGHENERLDDGTTDIDTMDASEYTLEPYMRNMMIQLEVRR